MKCVVLNAKTCECHKCFSDKLSVSVCDSEKWSKLTGATSKLLLWIARLPHCKDYKDHRPRNIAAGGDLGLKVWENTPAVAELLPDDIWLLHDCSYYYVASFSKFLINSYKCCIVSNSCSSQFSRLLQVRSRIQETSRGANRKIVQDVQWNNLWQSGKCLRGSHKMWDVVWSTLANSCLGFTEVRCFHCYRVPTKWNLHWC